MSIVAPKLLFVREQHKQVPVWEITTEYGKRIYYEREHLEGFHPKGLIDRFSLSGHNVDVYKEVITNGFTPEILKVSDGYTAPMSWYEKEYSH